MYSRYLYRRTDVENALVISLLFPSKNYQNNKKNLFHDENNNENDISEPAFFWAYELYYSGFIRQLCYLLWRIYYDFYVIKCRYLHKYMDEFLNETEVKKRPTIIGVFVKNFLYNCPTLDVYLLSRNLPLNYDMFCHHTITNERTSVFMDLIVLIQKRTDLSHSTSLLLIDKVFDYITATKTPATTLNNDMTYNNVATFRSIILNHSYLNILGLKRILYAYMMSYEYENNCKNREKLSLTPPLFLTGFESITKYKTVIASKDCHARSILAKGRQCDLREHLPYISLRIYDWNNPYISSAYDVIYDEINNWLYYSSSTPYWNKRIDYYGGTVNNITKSIVWDNELDMDVFMSLYDYDPEEQPFEVIAKTKCHINSAEITLEYFANHFYMQEWQKNNPHLLSMSQSLGLDNNMRAIACAIGHQPLRLPDNELVMVVKNILGETHKDELNWYLHVIVRLEIPLESLKNVKYRALKRALSKHVLTPDLLSDSFAKITV